MVCPLAVDREGNALCLWNERNEKRTEWNMKSALLLAGTSQWKKIPFPEIAIPDDNRRADPILASDSEGSILALWYYGNDTYLMKSSKFSMKEKSWSEPIEVMRSNMIPYYKSLSFDPFGNALFLWMSNEKWTADEKSQYALHAATLPKGNTSLWTAPEVILADTALQGAPDVAFSKDGRCQAIFWKEHPDVRSYAVQTIEGTYVQQK